MKHFTKYIFLLFLFFNATVSFSQGPSISEVISGCSDSEACNYNSEANTDDGSCVEQSMFTLTVETCEEEFLWYDTIRTSSGIYVIPANDTLSCDSILELTLLQNYSTTSDTTVCDEFVWEEDTITSSGLHTKSFTDENSCDSTHTFNVTVNTSTYTSSEETACGSYYWPTDQEEYFQSGTYQFGYTNSNECSSLVELDLTINESYILNDTVVAVCDSYIWRGETLTQSGLYTKTFFTDFGCDSIRTLNLTIFNSDTTESDTTVCDEFVLQGITYTTSGVYFTTGLENINDCDSTHFYNVTVNSTEYVTNAPIIECSESYTWQVNGVTYFEDNYTDEAVLINAASNGTCDLIVTIDLTFEEPSSSTETIERCNEFTWIDGITYTESTNTPTFVLQNSVGCDSVITLDLTINYSDTTSSSITSCNEYTWENSTYTESGSYTKTLSNQNSCDSIHTLNLIINYSDSTFSDITFCDEFIWQGDTYTESDTITKTLANSNGCDSIHTYNLTIFESSFGTDIQVACDSLTWIDGITYTESTDSATFVLTNSVECDSVVTLDLTINYSDSTFSDTTVCNAFVWDDSTYTASGVYTNGGYTNANGCDSSHTFNLIVNYSDTIFVDSTVCDVLVWEGDTYTESDTITKTLENLNGCDSVVTIDLTIVNSSVATFIDSTVC
ncbi:MAG: hypothetical protein P8N00_03740, partial [Flavobacteriales bacterium]|nr:hypothetical protein [Flavobacteriales bacterium]